MNQKDFEIFGATGYTTMCNYHFQDKNLTLKAKGLLGLMLSLPKNWDYSINGLATLSKDGRDSIRSCLDEENGNISTAYDMALLTSYAMENKDYRKIVKAR